MHLETHTHIYIYIYIYIYIVYIDIHALLNYILFLLVFGEKIWQKNELK